MYLLSIIGMHLFVAFFLSFHLHVFYWFGFIASFNNFGFHLMHHISCWQSTVGVFVVYKFTSSICCSENVAAAAVATNSFQQFFKINNIELGEVHSFTLKFHMESKK